MPSETAMASGRPVAVTSESGPMPVASPSGINTASSPRNPTTSASSADAGPDPSNVTISPTRTPGTLARTTRPVTSVTRPDSRRGAALSSRASAWPRSSALRGLSAMTAPGGERPLERGELRFEPRVDAPLRRLDHAAVAPDGLVGAELDHRCGCPGHERRPARFDGCQIVGVNPDANGARARTAGGQRLADDLGQCL